jgi:hypothetical protein
VLVGDHQLRPAQAAARERGQEARPDALSSLAAMSTPRMSVHQRQQMAVTMSTAIEPTRPGSVADMEVGGIEIDIGNST